MNMTPLELQIGKIMARTRFYRLFSFLLRLTGNMTSPVLFTATNYGHMKQARIERKRLPGLREELLDHYV